MEKTFGGNSGNDRIGVVLPIRPVDRKNQQNEVVSFADFQVWRHRRVQKRDAAEAGKLLCAYAAKQNCSISGRTPVG